MNWSLAHDRVREILLKRHRLRGLTVQHESIVAKSPFGTAIKLLAREAELGANAVMTEGRLVKQVSEATVELHGIGITDFEHAIFDAEDFVMVFTQWHFRELRSPTVEVFTIEQRDPIFSVAKTDGQEGDEGDGCGSFHGVSE